MRSGSRPVRLRALLIAPCLLISLSAEPGRPAGAQVASPALTPARITVESPLPRGESSALPALAVRNQGDSALTYQMAALPADDHTPAEVASWVRFVPAEFTLPPGGAQPVSVTLAVPDDGEDGAYRLLLRAGVLPGSGAGGLNLAVGVAVASVLEFQVGTERSAGLTRYWPVLLAAILAGAAAYGLGSLADRYEVRLSVRR